MMMVSNDVKESASVLEHTIDGGILRIEDWVAACLHEEEEGSG